MTNSLLVKTRLSMPSTSRLLFTNGTLILADRLIDDGELLFEQGVIQSAGPKLMPAKFGGER